MEQQTIIWTALPNGISEENNLKLSVLVSPRLKCSGTAATLAQFPDFLDWPQANLSFDVLFENGPSVAAKVDTKHKPCSQCWKALFKTSTYVKPYIFDDLSKQEVTSYPVQETFSQIKYRYTKCAESCSTDFPDFKKLECIFGRDFLKEERCLELFKEFHQPQKSITLVDENTPEKLDFHQIISMIGDFPYLMRKLGLIIDLEIPLTDDIHIPENSSIQIIPSWKVEEDESQNSNLGLTEQQYREDICPKTHYFYDKITSQFSAALKHPNTILENGLLKLDDTDTFAVMQIDVDGIVIKLLEFIRNVENLQRNDKLLSLDSPTSYALPNMRSAGLSLVQSERGEQLTESFQNSTDLNNNVENGTNVELFAEDLIRGYRIDVLDSKNKWYSLCKRQGEYHFLDGDFTLPEEDEEGFISLGATSIGDKLKLHESLVTWVGWSLVVPPLKSNCNIADPEEIVETELKLKTTFSVPPKSLPKLRFGESYQLRARVVDLAGNSRELGEKPNDCSGLTPSVKYRRFEPINSPVVARTKDDNNTEVPMISGESLERMVIRSSYHKPLLKNSCERIIDVPTVSQHLAETHSKFDMPDRSLDKKAYNSIVSGSEYLPHGDPLARGAAISGLPVSFSQELIKVHFRDSYFTLEITEGPNKISWNKKNRLLTIYIPKAEVFKIKLSSYLDQKDLELMGIWGWLEEEVEEEDLDLPALTTLRDNALDGKMWLLTPYREITLVHAVQQPLITPKFQKLTAEKDLNATFVTLMDTFMIDGKSTSKLEVVAEWNEPKDKNVLIHTLGEDLISKNEMNECKSCAVDSIIIEENQTWITLNHQHNFSDTKHRLVKYKAVATSRFSEYFYEPNDEKITLKGTNNKQLAYDSIVDGTEKVRGKSLQYVCDTDYEIDYIKGTIKRKTCSRIGDNEKLTIEYQYLPVSTNCESQEVSINILNSARPVAPKIQRIVPNFEWEEREDSEVKVVNRKAGRLRIYLEQPPISSGEGELLGVILQSCNNTQISDQLKPYVTQWGMDSIWTSNKLPPLPRLENFKQAKATDVGLSLLGIGDETVNVAGHSIKYDQEQQLWFCDVEIDSGNSYYPFVRLALASYQPNSVPDAHLSQVVLEDPVQLLPDRLATVRKNPSDPRLLNVSLCGPGYWKSSVTSEGKSEKTTDVEVIIEKQVLNNEWISILGSTSLLTQTEFTELFTPRMTWMGQVILPDVPSSSNKYRVVIKEFEWFLVDGDPQDPINSPDMKRRLVYASLPIEV